MSKNPSGDSTSKEAKPKQSKKRSSNPKKTKGSGSSSAKPERNDLSFTNYESNADASQIPAPVCTCTGVARQCYRGGAGAWQSSCCTTHISEYPLPMSTTRPGSRMNRVILAAGVAVVNGQSEQGHKWKSGIKSFPVGMKSLISGSAVGSKFDEFTGEGRRRVASDESLRQVMYLNCWGQS